MRQTTQKLLDRLHSSNPDRQYRVDEAEIAGDSEVIHLHGDYVLAIDEDSALPTVSLDERMKVGGNVEIASWVIDDEAVLDKVVAAALEGEM